MSPAVSWLVLIIVVAALYLLLLGLAVSAGDPAERARRRAERAHEKPRCDIPGCDCPVAVKARQDVALVDDLAARWGKQIKP